MEHRKELLESRIANICDPVQKRLLQDVLVDVFGELLQYSEESFHALEQKIDRELYVPSSCYDIYTGICKKDGLDSASRSFFEIKKTEKRAPGYIGTLFLACGYPEICKCLAQTYRAHVVTETGEYQTQVKLTYCLAYPDTFSWLYQQFVRNQRTWHTINCPFLYKLFDITDQEGVIPQDVPVVKAEIDLGEFSGYMMDDMVLVWNLSEIECRPRVDVQAAGNTAFYAHSIPLMDQGYKSQQNQTAGYLAVPEGEDLFTTVFTEDGMLVRTEKEAHQSMNLVKIEPLNKEKDHTAFLYPPASNRRILRHADRQALGQPRYLWTKGEVYRMLSSYEAFGDFELLDVCPDMQGELQAIGMNPFIRVNSFLKQKRKMALILHAKDPADIFLYEKMYFLLAELQLCTQEYEWTGILR